MIRRPPRSTLFPYTPLSRPPGIRPPPGRAQRPRAHQHGARRQGQVCGAVEGVDVELDAEDEMPDQVGDPGGQERPRSEEHTSELQSLAYLVCRLLLEKKKTT